MTCEQKRYWCEVDWYCLLGANDNVEKPAQRQLPVVLVDPGQMSTYRTYIDDAHDRKNLIERVVGRK
jgi:hypothetical protein